ncbi:PREDICTED: potassium channel subfamily K member 16-like [Gavialis gangeticus]|uniref:potassium channel subfamily K member 16-like n=1 Tax=Gavialis gangeticus TaxID=94835 RepID=UPI00092FAEFB|nr:PREDICTED: potassium channel subfamily K member 16-like [Gavialis gangeticus]
MPMTAMCSRKVQTCLLVVSYFTYLFLGAIVFQALERDAEEHEKTAVIQMKQAFLQNFAHLTVGDVEQFVKNLTEAIQKGVYPIRNESQVEQSNWDFSSSFFFVGTVVSTIGYGKLCPKTAGGQLFCVFFALFGIPLNIVFLHRVGKILSLLCKRLGKCLYEKGMKKKKTKFLTLLFFLVMGILVFLCLPSLVFQIVEGWSYSEGIYFAFITLSTIGFGDYVVGKQPERHYFSYYRSFVAIWIIFGLAWTALLFNLLMMLLEDTEKKIAKDLHKMGKAGKENEETLKNYQPAGLLEEGPLSLDSGGDARDCEEAKLEKNMFSLERNVVRSD